MIVRMDANDSYKLEFVGNNLSTSLNNAQRLTGYSNDRSSLININSVLNESTFQELRDKLFGVTRALENGIFVSEKSRHNSYGDKMVDFFCGRFTDLFSTELQSSLQSSYRKKIESFKTLVPNQLLGGAVDLLFLALDYFLKLENIASNDFKTRVHGVINIIGVTLGRCFENLLDSQKDQIQNWISQFDHLPEVSGLMRRNIAGESSILADRILGKDSAKADYYDPLTKAA